MKLGSSKREVIHHNFVRIPRRSLCVSGWYLLNFPKDFNNFNFLELLNSHETILIKRLTSSKIIQFCCIIHSYPCWWHLYEAEGCFCEWMEHASVCVRPSFLSSPALSPTVLWELPHCRLCPTQPRSSCSPGSGYKATSRAIPTPPPCKTEKRCI